MPDFYYATVNADGSAARTDHFDHQPSSSQLFPAAGQTVVTLTAQQYTEWTANLSSRAWVGGALTTVPTNEVWEVTKLLVIERLGAIGKLRDAYAALKMDVPMSDPSMTDAAFLLRERFVSCVTLFSNDAQAIGLFQAIGADPAVILAKPPAGS